VVQPNRARVTLTVRRVLLAGNREIDMHTPIPPLYLHEHARTLDWRLDIAFMEDVAARVGKERGLVVCGANARVGEWSVESGRSCLCEQQSSERRKQRASKACKCRFALGVLNHL